VLEQPCTHAESLGRSGQGLVERAQQQPVVRRDRQVQGVPRPQAGGVLRDELRSDPVVEAGNRQGDQGRLFDRVKRGEDFRPVLRTKAARA
jgi:hypothetical protein